MPPSVGTWRLTGENQASEFNGREPVLKFVEPLLGQSGGLGRLLTGTPRGARSECWRRSLVPATLTFADRSADRAAPRMPPRLLWTLSSVHSSMLMATKRFMRKWS